MNLEIYVHGYCLVNEVQKFGGYCANVVYKTYDYTVTSLGSNTTSNSLEIQALIHALKGVGSSYNEIKIFSNNGYIVDCINLYLSQWRVKNFKGIANKAFWMEYSSLTANKFVIAVKLDNQTNERNKFCFKTAKEQALLAKTQAEEWAKLFG